LTDGQGVQKLTSGRSTELDGKQFHNLQSSRESSPTKVSFSKSPLKSRNSFDSPFKLQSKTQISSNDVNSKEENNSNNDGQDNGFSIPASSQRKIVN
jgi:hypothetical protein